MAKNDNLTDFFADLANAIREKEGSSSLINPQDMAARVAAIGGKVLVSTPRTTLKEILQDIADGIRMAEGSEGLINPQDMAARIMSINQASQETYTRLAYIECNGAQYIDLGYVVQENDVIEIRYIPTAKESGRFYGTVDSTGNSIYWSFSQGDGYARFGQKSSQSINEGIESSFCILQKGSVSIDTYTTTLTYSAMPTTPIYLFACCEEGQAVNKASFRCRGFSIHNDNGDVMRLLPYKRDSDGVIGMLDEVSRRFFTNDGEGVFIAGSIMVLPDGYTFIEEVSFNADTLYDMGIITSEDSIDIQYKREDTSSSQYLYGITNSSNTASVTAYLASNGAWRFGNQLVRPNTADKNVHHTTISNGSAIHDGSAMVMNTSPAFVTENTVVLGGYRDASGITTKGYIGKVLYIRINDGTKIDWLPCKRLSDGVEGFWDCVTQTFVEPM